MYVYIYVYKYIYIYMVPAPLVPGFCLISVIFSGNFDLLAKLGHQGRGRATILQLRILDSRLLGDVQCDNLEFKIQYFKYSFLEFWNIESCIPFFVSRIQDLIFQKNIVWES